MTNMYKVNMIIRKACAISDEIHDVVIITGGYTIEEYAITPSHQNITDRVISYDKDGSSTILPNLVTARYNHGCSAYVNNDNEMVMV